MAVFTGTAGDDSLVGTSGGDDFHLEQGGDDTAIGGGGIDVFYLGATFGSGDQIDGGDGNDVLVLDGDYSASVAFIPTTLTSVEKLLLTAGHDYVLTGLTDANIDRSLKVFGGTLAATDSLRVDASGATKGLDIQGGASADTLVGGAGDDILDGGASGRDSLVGGAGIDRFHLGSGVTVAKGGDGDDGFEFNSPGAFSVRDKIDGGAGSDWVMIAGDYDQPIVLKAGTLRNMEGMSIQNTGHTFDVTAPDSLVAAGQTFGVDNQSGSGMMFDGSAETDGRYVLVGSFTGHSTMIGGAGDDTIIGAKGGDTMIGGDGDDTIYVNNPGAAYKIVGGLGQDTMSGSTSADSFFFLDAQDSTADRPDLITNLEDQDVIWLRPIDANTHKAGNQAFHLVESFTGHAGELVVAEDRARHVTTFSGDVDGDGQADLVIQVSGKHGDFTNFEL